MGKQQDLELMFNQETPVSLELNSVAISHQRASVLVSALCCTHPRYRRVLLELVAWDVKVDNGIIRKLDGVAKEQSLLA